MTLTKSEQKETLTSSFIKKLFEYSTIPDNIGSPVALWLLNKAIVNHVALDITDADCHLAIKLTIKLDFHYLPTEELDAVVDYCFKKSALFTKAKELMHAIDESPEIEIPHEIYVNFKTVALQTYCSEEPITEIISNAA